MESNENRLVRLWQQGKRIQKSPRLWGEPRDSLAYEKKLGLPARAREGPKARARGAAVRKPRK